MMSGWRRTSREVMQPCTVVSADEAELTAVAARQRGLGEQHRRALHPLPTEPCADVIRGGDEVTERRDDLLRQLGRGGSARGLHVWNPLATGMPAVARRARGGNSGLCVSARHRDCSRSRANYRTACRAIPGAWMWGASSSASSV